MSLSLGTPRSFRLRPSPDPDNPLLDVLGRPLRTYEVVLPHNSILIMVRSHKDAVRLGTSMSDGMLVSSKQHAGCQELYKHSVAPLGKGKSLDLFRPAWDIEGNPIEPANREKRIERINITFRFYRPDYQPIAKGARKGTPVCRCGIPT